jgi:uracil-DNA glycosylase
VSETSITPEQLQRQVAQHLDALRLAGVEWLPKGTGAAVSLPTPQAEPPANAPSLASAPSMSLFGGPDNSPPAEAQQDAMTINQRRTELQVLAKSVSGCTRCGELAATRTQTVFADGQIPVELCFIGEAPGADEDVQGIPFVGKAGQLLDRIIVATGLTRAEVYICNIIKCRPPGNRTPKPEEADNCSEYLHRQLELARPKFICALGGCAAQNLLKTTQSLGMLRGRFHDYRGIPVICTYHPSYLLPHRNPAKKHDVWEDMKMLMKRMGRTIPTAK